MSPFRAKWPYWAPTKEGTVIDLIEGPENILAVCVLDDGHIDVCPVWDLLVASRPLDWPVLP